MSALYPLHQVNVSSLTLGSCSSLLGLELSSRRVSRLDVSGCGSLQQLCLDCPGLKVLDANFCGSLADEGLVAAVANCPPLERLVLSVCCQVRSVAGCWPAGQQRHCTWCGSCLAQQVAQLLRPGCCIPVLPGLGFALTQKEASTL